MFGEGLMYSVHKVLAFLIIPVMIASVAVGFAQQSKIIELEPTDDAYVVGDLNDPADSLGLRTLNTGNFKFLKVWYAWNVTGAQDKKIVSLAYLNFDLSGLNPDQISSAKLKIYMQNVTLTGISRFVDVHVANVSPWEESSLVYRNAPSFSANKTASASVSVIGWYEWDLTKTVKEKTGSNFTVVVLLQKLLQNKEEQVVFTSKETDDPTLIPRLVIERSTTPAAVGDSGLTWMPAMIVGIAVGVGGAAAGFIFYRRRNQQGSTLHVSSQIPKETSPNLCPNCGKSISKDFNVCPFCEYDLRKIKCANCGKDISKDYKVCPYCSSKINP